MTDYDDNEIPFQIIRGKHTNFGNKYDTIFMAEIPPMGYAVYRFFTEKESVTEFENELKVSETMLENSKIRVELSDEAGDICRIYDKKNGVYIIDGPCRAEVLDETHCNTWGHDVDELGDIIGEFKNPKFKVIERGGVRASVRVISEYNGSTLERTYTVTSESNRVDVRTRLDFHEKHRTVKFAFPLSGDKVIAKIPYGTVSREIYTGEEPFGSWFAIGNLCVANDSKYAYDTKCGEARLTVLRTTMYGDHYCERDEFCEYMDMGIHEFSYSIFPYKSNSEAEKTASAFNFGLRAVTGSFHGGNLPLKMSCFVCDNDDVIVSAVKKSEDSDEAVIRFYEINGNSGELSFKLFDKEIHSSIGHNELKTFSQDGKILNLIEWEK